MRRIRPSETLIALLTGAVMLLAIGGCEMPVPFELSPLDPGTYSFEFPAERLTVTGSAPTSLMLSWVTRSSTVTEFVVERATDEYPLAEYVRLTGATRAWTDLSVLQGHTYTYRLRAIGPLGVSAPAAVKTWWQMQILHETDELLMPTSSTIGSMAMSEQTDASRILTAQADGRLTLFTYNGVRFAQTATTVLARPTNGVAVSPYGDFAVAAAESTLTVFAQPLQVRAVIKLPSTVLSPSFSLSGFRFLTGGGDGVLRIWRSSDGGLIDSVLVPDGPIAECLYDRSGEVIGVLSQNGTVRFYRVNDLSVISSTVVPGGTRLSFEDSGTMAVVTRPAAGTGRVVRVSDGGTIKEIDGPSNLRRAVFLQTTTSVLLIGGLPGPRLYDVTRSMDLPLPASLTGDVALVANGELGRRLAFSTGSNRVSVWYAQPHWITVPL